MRDYLANFQKIEIPIVALGMFFVLFVACVFWVYRKNGAKFYEQMAMLPIEEKTHE